jgi:hypothetical protein
LASRLWVAIVCNCERSPSHQSASTASSGRPAGHHCTDRGGEPTTWQRTRFLAPGISRQPALLTSTPFPASFNASRRTKTLRGRSNSRPASSELSPSLDRIAVTGLDMASAQNALIG